MKRLRVRLLLLIGWLIVFNSAERLINPINISAVTYSLVIAMVVVILAAPKFIKDSRLGNHDYIDWPVVGD